MRSHCALFLSALFYCYLPSNQMNVAGDEPPSSAKQNESGVRSFVVSGVIKELGTDSRTVVVQHEAVAG